jgi:hypothetical protein
MRQGMLFVAAVVGVIAALFPSYAAAQTPTQDSAVGSGEIAVNFEEFWTNAYSDPDGSNPTGTAGGQSRSTGGGAVNGHVTCLNVVGNRATIGFNNDLSGTFPPAGGGLIYVRDNGTPGAGLDQAVYSGSPFGDAPSVCPDPPSAADFPQFGIATGDVTVVDAPTPSPLPRPITKRQCRLGGWATLGFPSKRVCLYVVRFQCTGGRWVNYGYPSAEVCRIVINRL